MRGFVLTFSVIWGVIAAVVARADIFEIHVYVGWISEPPDCPFDRIFLQFVPECKKMLWTKLDSRADYNRIIECSKIAASGQSL